jgi:hypothetical protein
MDMTLSSSTQLNSHHSSLNITLSSSTQLNTQHHMDITLLPSTQLNTHRPSLNMTLRSSTPKVNHATLNQLFPSTHLHTNYTSPNRMVMTLTSPPTRFHPRHPLNNPHLSFKKPHHNPHNLRNKINQLSALLKNTDTVKKQIAKS